VPDREPVEATESDKAALVTEALRHLKASGASQDRARWFFEVLVEAAGVEPVRLALTVFDPDFVTSKKLKRGRKRRFGPGVLERQIARRFAAYQALRPGKSVKALHSGFVATLPPHFRGAGQSWKTTANDIAAGNRLNQQRPLLLRLAEEMKRQRGLVGPSKRDIAQQLRTLAETASDAELRDKLTEAQYLRWCAELALLQK
jgi:hypothetical protein